jgi:ankyrin repeat protein
MADHQIGEQKQQNLTSGVASDLGSSERLESQPGGDEMEPLDAQLHEVVSPTQGTGQWIFDRDEYRTWRASKTPGVLLVLAPPGLGKTVLAKSICARLKKELGDKKVLAFFCKSKNPGRESTLTIIASFLYRLLADNEIPTLGQRSDIENGIIRVLDPYLKEAKSGADELLTFDKVWQLFLNICGQPFASGYAFIIDALDECILASQGDLQRALSRCKDVFRGRLLITARRELITTILADYFPATTIEANASTFSDDAERFVLTDLQERGLGSLISDEFVQMIQRKVREGADGMFLIFSCRLDELQTRMYREDFVTSEEYLQQFMDLPFLPVLEYFAQMLDNLVASPQAGLGVTILDILLASQLPLTRAQLTAAYSFSQQNFPSHRDYLKERGRRQDLFFEAKKLCGSMVWIPGNIKSETTTIDIVHEKARALLESDPDPTFPPRRSDCLRQIGSKHGHVMMAIACLRYLLLPEITAITVQHFKTYPFMVYALFYWPVHVAKSEERISEYESLLGSFLAASEQGYGLWASFWSQPEPGDRNRPSPPQPISLTIVRHGLINILDRLSESGLVRRFWSLPGCNIDLNERDFTGDTALLVAIGGIDEAENKEGDSIDERSTFFKIAERLLDLGVDPNLSNDLGVTPLHVATLRHSRPLIKKLVAKGAVVEAETIHRPAKESSDVIHAETPLWWTLTDSSDVSIEVFELLYTLGARKMVRSDDQWPMLHVAAYYDLLGFVKHLVDRGYIDINETSPDGTTALIAAAGAPNGLETVRYLMTHENLDINKATINGKTAFWEALYFQRPEIATLLLPQTENIHTAPTGIEGLEGWTPLHLCAVRGYIDIAEVLIRRQVDVNATTKSRQSALLLAVSEGNTDMARFLIQKDADVNLADESGKFPLISASTGGHIGIVESLLDAHADSSAKNNDGSALHMAAWYNYPRIAECLIKARTASEGVDEVRTDSGFTPLHCALRQNNCTVARLLLASGADVCAATSKDWLPIHFVCYYSKDELLFDLLLSKTPDDCVSASSSYGSTPLGFAAAEGFDHAVSALLEKGADASIADSSSTTPLMYAAISGSAKTFKLIFDDENCLPGKQNKSGETALHFACRFLHDYDTIEKLMKATEWQCRKRSPPTPIVTAAAFGNKPALTALLRNGMPAEFCSDSGLSPLEYAANLDSVEMVDLLLDHGAQLNRLTSFNVLPYVLALGNGIAPIIGALKPKNTDLLGRKANTNYVTAVQLGAGYDVDTVKWMIEGGQSPTGRTLIGWTALHIAAESRRSDVLEYLLDQPLMLSHVDFEVDLSRQTALMVAAQSRSPECVRLLLQKGHANYNHVDYLTLSVYDYASYHQDTLKVLADFSPQSYEAWINEVRTDDEQRQDIRRRTGSLIAWIRSLPKDCQYYPRMQESGIGLLSSMLFYAGDKENRMTACEILYGRLPKPLEGFIYCVICLKRKRGFGYICSQCPYGGFCAECKDDREKMKVFGCDGHDLLRMPRESWSKRDLGHVNDQEQTEEAWLEDLEKSYRKDTPEPIKSETPKGLLHSHARDTELSIQWSYPQERRNVFDFCCSRQWDLLKTHLLMFPRDTELKDSAGDNMTMWALRNTSGDAECLEILQLLCAEAVPMLVRNTLNETTIELACKREFPQCLTFLLSRYDPEFNKVEDEFSSDAMRLILEKRWHNALEFAIERHFEWASRGSFELLENLDGLGLSDKDIIDFLENNPEVFTESPQPDNREIALAKFQQPETGHKPAERKHASDCVHNLRGGMTFEQHTPQQSPFESPESFENTQHNTNEQSDRSHIEHTKRSASPTSDSSSVSDRAAYLCGFAGVFPDKEGSISVTHRDGMSVALVSFGSNDDEGSTYKTSMRALLTATRGLMEAMYATQRAGLCCDAFTVLCDAKSASGANTSPLVNLCRIPFAVIMRFADDIEHMATKSLTEAQMPPLAPMESGSVTEIRNICSFSKHALKEDVEGQLNEYCKLIQFLCLGFLTFLGAHSSHLQLSILGVADLPSVIMRGTGGPGAIAARPRKMACIGQMLQEDLIVFCELESYETELSMELSEPSRVVANVEDVLEIWGPGYCIYKKESDGSVTGDLLAVALRQGFLCLTDDDGDGDGGGRGAHWFSTTTTKGSDGAWKLPTIDGQFVSGEEFLSGKLQSPSDLLSFHSQEPLVIGGLKKNAECPISKNEAYRRATYEQARGNAQTCDLKTAPWRYKLKSVSTNASAAQYLGVGIGAGWDRIPGKSKKNCIVKRWAQSQGRMDAKKQEWSEADFHTLSEPYGLVFSICSSFAKRVPLREALAEGWLVYTAELIDNRAHWPAMRQDIRSLLKGERPPQWPAADQFDPDAALKNYIKGLSQPEQASLHLIMFDILDTLQDTGVQDTRDCFRVAWPQVHEPHGGYEFQCSGGNRAEWVRLLQDTHQVATFAIMTNDCLVEDRKHWHRCKNYHRTAAMLNTLALLDTRIVLHDDHIQLGDGCYLVLTAEGPLNAKTPGLHTKIACQIQHIGQRGSDVIVLGDGDFWAKLNVAFCNAHKAKEAWQKVHSDFDKSEPVIVTPFKYWRDGVLSN